jgi:predicted acylesterase/phospholipase RssA/CRP-like cAMP-binding protein
MPTPDLAEFLRTTDLFRDVPADALDHLAAQLTEVSLRDGETLVRQGDVDENLYLVREGTLRLASDHAANASQALFDVHPGESVTEMAITSADPSPVAITAAGNTRAVVLSRAAFDRFSESRPAAALAMMQSMSRGMQRYRLAVALHSSNLFDNFQPEALRDLVSELEVFTVEGGDILFRQGDPGDYLCLIISGRVSVLLAAEQGLGTAVTELGFGELVGEMAVVSDQIRTATVRAIRDTQLAKLTKAAYERFLVRHPAAAVRMVTRTLAERLRETTSGRTWRPRSVSTFAVVPVHPDAPAGDFCERLTKALSAFGPALHLARGSVDAHLQDERLTEWLNRQELEHSYLIYEADSTPSPWTERCVRQADRVLLLADGASDPAPGEMEAALKQRLDGQAPSLVLVHAKGDPSGTTRWLDARTVERHFHVRSGDDHTVARAARILTGRAVALTLGGGFARGIAHIGVFRAFDEMGIAVDAVGGASMGAIVGGFFAMGWDRETIHRQIAAICTDIYGDLTFPFVAFKTGRKFSRSVRELIGELQIEDLWTPYFCVSANLNRSELKVHSRGSLAKAVLAASRAPGVFPPIIYDGELHVDGGVISNVPVDLMKAFSNLGIVVGIDVSPPHELNPTSDYGDMVSGWPAFWRRWNPLRGRYVYTPSILLVMIRTLEFTGISYKNARLKSADIYMHPDTLKFRRTDFHRAAEIEQAGFDCARKAVAEWMQNNDAAAARRPDLFRGNLRTAPSGHGSVSGSE